VRELNTSFWDGNDARGNRAPSGVYRAEFSVDGNKTHLKVVIVR